MSIWAALNWGQRSLIFSLSEMKLVGQRHRVWPEAGRKKKKTGLYMIKIHCKNFITAFFKKCNFFQIQNLTDHTIVYTQTDWHLFSLKKFWGVHLRSKIFWSHNKFSKMTFLSILPQEDFSTRWRYEGQKENVCSEIFH